MSARERLLNFIASNEPDDGRTMGYDEEVGLLVGDDYVRHAGKLIDACAHELAEKQRAAEAQWRQSGYEGTRPKGWLIDEIDPEVSTDG